MWSDVKRLNCPWGPSPTDALVHAIASKHATTWHNLRLSNTVSGTLSNLIWNSQAWVSFEAVTASLINMTPLLAGHSNWLIKRTDHGMRVKRYWALTSGTHKICGAELTCADALRVTIVVSQYKCDDTASKTRNYRTYKPNVLSMFESLLFASGWFMCLWLS